MLDRRPARVWNSLRRKFPPNRTDAWRHLDVLRRRPRPRLATQHCYERKLAPAGQYPPVVWRFARPLGRQYAGDRCDEFQSENGFSGLAGEIASGRTLDADRTEHPGVRGYD